MWSREDSRCLPTFRRADLHQRPSLSSGRLGTHNQRLPTRAGRHPGADALCGSLPLCLPPVVRGEALLVTAARSFVTGQLPVGIGRLTPCFPSGSRIFRNRSYSESVSGPELLSFCSLRGGYWTYVFISPLM